MLYIYIFPSLFRKQDTRHVFFFLLLHGVWLISYSFFRFQYRAAVKKEEVMSEKSKVENEDKDNTQKKRRLEQDG